MAQMEARLRIVADDQTARAFHDLEARIARISQTASRISVPSGAGIRVPGGLVAPGAPAMPSGVSGVSGAAGAAAVASRGAGFALPSFLAAGALAAGARSAVGSFADLEAKIMSLGVTAEATDAEMKSAMATFRQLGPQFGVTAAQISEAAEKYVAAGIDFRAAIESTPAAIRAAKASGAELGDIVDAGVASMQNLDIGVNDLDRAYDIMAKGGKLGSFELRNMARELPEVAARAKGLGLVGEDGLTKIVAMLETARRTTATGEAAANNLTNFFDKITSDDTAAHFAKQGVDIRKVLRENAKKGVDYVTTMVRLVDQMTGGDPFKVGGLFPDRQARMAILALIQYKDFYKKTAEEINATAIGTNQRDLQKRLETTKSAIDRMSSAWDIFAGKLGETIAPLITPAIEGATEFLSRLDKPSDGEGQKKFNRLANALVGRDGDGSLLGGPSAPPEIDPAEMKRLRDAAEDFERRKAEVERAQAAVTSAGGPGFLDYTFGYGEHSSRMREANRARVSLNEARAAQERLGQFGAAQWAASGLGGGPGAALGGLPLPAAMQNGVSSRALKLEIPEPPPVKLDGAADIGITVRIEAPELLRAYEASRSVNARGALSADTGVSMTEAAPRR